jgi:hypothetical protein
MANPRAKFLVVCIDNEGYPASLERRKIYVSLRDAEAEKHRSCGSSMKPVTLISTRGHCFV